MPETADEHTELQKISKGAVLLWKNFEFFETGEKKDSFFLVLSDYHPQYKSFLAIRATTKTELYEKSDSIKKEFIIVEAHSERPLPEKSAIDLLRTRSLDWRDMRPFWNNQNGIKLVGTISQGLIDTIDKLVNDSRTLRRDWKTWILKSPPLISLTSEMFEAKPRTFHRGLPYGSPFYSVNPSPSR